MFKTGRNYPCPCGSGKKFKKCCIGTVIATPVPPVVPSLQAEIAKLQESAAARQSGLISLGVFILFSTETGDAWVLEVTDMDAVQVARAGEPIAIEIEENPEAITVNWTHRFRISERRCILTAYSDNTEEVREGFPVHGILATAKKIRDSIPPHLLRKLHLESH